MSIYWDSITTAINLIITLDKDLYSIIYLSLKVTFTSLLISIILGIPLGTLLAIQKFSGRPIIISIINSLMSVSPVVVGLLVYINFSRSGPFGWLGLLYTPTAMIIAQTILIFPIITGLSCQIIENVHENYKDLFNSLVTSKVQAIIAYILDTRLSLLTVVLAGMSRGISEVGAVIIVGGNIDYLTRVMTTTIALESSKGELSLALALGIILFFLVMIINFLATWHKQFSIGKTNVT